ncbi:MAG: hypothetical protein IPJ75_06805 [Ignavibacteriales bacterium]|nr:hypothetical protein [Ignavibacteriales bacterium]
MLTQRPDLWEEVLDSSFIAADSKIYYTKDDTGFRPVDPYKEPEANLNNILILKDQSQLSSIKAKVKVKRYKQKFDEVTLGFPELISDLSDEGSLFLVYEESYGKKIVNIFFVNTLLNYFHLYSFEVDDFSITALQNKTLKGWLYAYVRIDNLLMIDKEFDSERKLKWRVPIGD